MELVRLRIRGFKSFSEPAVMEFSKGITAIVGPNGSGKSNVVDAIAWALGAQSTRLLRLGRMEELIWAGNGRKAALGRAEVTIEFERPDGSAGNGPAELAITRTIDRSGSAEYRLNNRSCRLADVAEVLAEANIGRSQHVIISQGEVDLLVNARGEELRAVLEDAAQVSLLRRRKEATERNLKAAAERLDELRLREREIRRRIKPLAAQSELYQRRLELLGLRDAVDRWLARCRLEDLQERHALARGRLSRIESELAAAKGGEIRPPHEHFLVARPLLDRAQALLDRIQEFRARVAKEQVALANELAAAERALSRRQGALEELDRLEAASKEAALLFETLEAEAGILTARRTEVLRRRSAFRETEPAPDGLEGRRRDLLGRLNAVEAERSRRKGAREALQAERVRRAARAEAVSAEISAGALGLDGLARKLEELRAWQEVAAGELLSARNESDAAAAARAEAAQLAERAQSELRRVEEELESVVRMAGIANEELLSTSFLLAHVKPSPEMRLAASAVLGEFADARLFPSLDELLAVMEQSAGSTFLGAVAEEGEAPESELLSASSPAWARRLFAGVTLVESVPRAVAAGARGVLVDREGVLYRGGLVKRGSSYRAAARIEAIRLEEAIVGARRNLGARREELARASALDEAARKRCEELDGAFERRNAERSRLEAAVAASEANLAALQREQDRHAAAEPVEGDEAGEADLDQEERSLRAELEQVRSDLERRRISEAERERERALIDQEEIAVQMAATALGARTAGVREALEANRRRRDELQAVVAPVAERAGSLEEMVRRRKACLEIAAELDALIGRTRLQLGKVAEAEAREAELVAGAERELAETRRRAEALNASLLEAATAESQVRTRLMAEEESALRRFGLALDELLSSELPAGVAPTAAEATLREVESKIAAVGEVNPLARAELSELSADLERFRREGGQAKEAWEEVASALSGVEAEMRDRLRQVVEEVSASFSKMMAKLFSGGDGSLELESPEDPLNSAASLRVVVPSKRVSRLSLLSGGERSLVGLAFLFAVLAVRPVPFVVLDEVEAALDEKNLAAFGRLISEVASLVQIIVVTHQRRTMEVAETLIGISLGANGGSRVVRHVLE